MIEFSQLINQNADADAFQLDDPDAGDKGETVGLLGTADGARTIVPQNQRFRKFALAILSVLLFWIFRLPNQKEQPKPTPIDSEVLQDPPIHTTNPTSDIIWSDLAKSTLAALKNQKNQNSNQTKALDWLEGHPNFTSMEDWRKTQLFALATYYYSTDGPHWKPSDSSGWLDYSVWECEWTAVTCDMDGAKVTSIEYWAGTHSCPLLPELGLLTAMNHIYWVENYFTGPIPTELGLLTALTSLKLYGNGLTGPIPSEMGLLTEMSRISLLHNHLTGPIPSELGLLTGLTSLRLGENELDGSISSELGLLTILIRLRLDNNNFTGHIPSQLGLLIAMNYLDLSDNKLSGSIPFELLLLPGVSHLFLFNNELTGTIPSELGLWSARHQVELQFNHLTGTIPSELGLLNSLCLDHNQLTGIIPPEVRDRFGERWITSLLATQNNSGPYL